MSEKLKPCPRCSNEPSLAKHRVRREYFIICHHCFTEIFLTKEEAIEAWNRKTDDE